MSETCIDVNGEQLVLDVSGAVYWPSQSTLVFADLHFEKGSFFAKEGSLLPPYDTRTTLARMADVVSRRTPRQVIALGDSFHDRDAASRLGSLERQQLNALTARADWIWIRGNHDPALPNWLEGIVVEEFARRGLLFRHEPSLVNGRGEVAGHLHPCTTVAGRGRALRRRCFISDGRRIVLPAFGAYAGGLDISDQAITSLFMATARAYVLGLRRVYGVAAS